MESRKLALIIGNSEYEDGNLSRLVTPDVDVTSLAEVLRSPEVGSFDEVTALVNQSAATIRRAISGFFVNRGRDDLLLLYFSGHGIRDDRGQLFLAVKDTEPGLLRGTAIPASFITEEMDNSRSRRQVLVLDCCHSGAFSHGMKGAPGGSVGTAAAFQGIGFGRVVLTATDSTQYAWEGDRVIGQVGNGAVLPSVFTKFLIQGLRSGNADTDGDGRITLDELYDYVYEQVVNETPRQTPSKWSYGQQGDIVLAQNPHPQVRAAALPQDLQQTIDDPRPWVREGAVRELDRLMRTSSPGMALAAREALNRLVNDDSRRVASAAEEILAASSTEDLPGGKQQSPGSQPADRSSIRQPATESSMMVTGPVVTAGTTKNMLGAISPSPVQNQEASVPMLEGTEGSTRAEPGTARIDRLTGGQLLNAALDNLSDIFQGSQGKKVLLISLVWALGGLVTGLIAWYGQKVQAGLFIGGLISGLAVGLALRQSQPRIQLKYILLITAGWAICWAFSGPATESFGSAFGNAAADKFYQPIGWENAMLIFKTIGLLISGLVVAVICVLPVGLALRQAEQAVPLKPAWKVVAGWTIIWTVISTILTMIVDLTNLDESTSIIFFLAISTLLTGWLGSQWMFRQLYQDRVT